MDIEVKETRIGGYVYVKIIVGQLIADPMADHFKNPGGCGWMRQVEDQSSCFK